MQFDSMQDYTPVSMQFTRLQPGESHFYSFHLTEVQKQLIGYKLLPVQYLCHLTDQRLIFEPQQPIASPHGFTTFQKLDCATNSQESSQESISTATALINHAFQFSHSAIAALKRIRTLNGAYAKLVLNPTEGQSDLQEIVFAVDAPQPLKRRKGSRATDFVQLGSELLGLEAASPLLPFQFDPQAVAQFTQEVQASSIPVLVDFWAPGCEPCELLHPVMDKLAAEYDGKIKLIKVNIEKNPSVAMQYKVDCFPTLVLFKAGTIADRIVGMMPKPILVKVLNKHLTA